MFEVVNTTYKSTGWSWLVTMENTHHTSLVAESTHIITKTEEKATKALTILLDELQDWQKDNSYILGGYREASGSYSKSFASLTYLHNESVNIWTHLIGACLAAAAGLIIYFDVKPRYHLATSEDVAVFSCYFLGAVACLGMSAIYHTVSDHSPAVARFGNRLDYIGIVFLIWGSFIPSIYYGFSAEPALVRVYWTMVRDWLLISGRRAHFG